MHVLSWSSTASRCWMLPADWTMIQALPMRSPVIARAGVLIGKRGLACTAPKTPTKPNKRHIGLMLPETARRARHRPAPRACCSAKEPPRPLQVDVAIALGGPRDAAVPF